MRTPVTGEGVVPGQPGNDPNVQNDQPNLQPQTPGQPTQPTLELLYQLSEPDRAAIMALPEDVRNPAIAALNQARIHQENGFNEQLKEGRQAIADNQVLFADPDFQDWLVGRGRPEQPPVAQNNPPLSQPNNFGNVYGDQTQQVEAFMNDMASRMKEALGIEDIQNALQGLQRSSVLNEQDRQWGALEEFAKANDLPDPNNTKSQIFMMRRTNPNMTLDQAYNATVDLRSLATRPPISAPANTEGGEPPAEQEIIPAGNAMPGTNKGSAAPRTETEIIDPTEAAFARRAEGKVVDPEQGMKDAFAGAIDTYNQNNGTSFTVDDFPNI